MKIGRTTLARIAVAALLAGSLVTVLSKPAHALTPRLCKTIYTGDYVRRLDVCHRGWVSDAALYTRGVVEMHTYAWSNSNGWVDSRSQSITVNWAWNDRNGTEVANWGQDRTQKCRVNGPAGRVACSVPNTVRVAFYGPQLYAPNWDQWVQCTYKVSWRDDRGVPHTPVYINDPQCSPVWSA